MPTDHRAIVEDLAAAPDVRSGGGGGGGGGGAWRQLLKSRPAAVGLGMLAAIIGACIFSLPWTLGTVAEPGLAALGEQQPSGPRYERQDRSAPRLPPVWATSDRYTPAIEAVAVDAATRAEADRRGTPYDHLAESGFTPTAEQVAANRPHYLLGTDHLGRSLTARVLLGGALSLLIGLAAAALSVVIGTLYGAIAGYAGGVVDGVMMRIVDVLYGLPYILLVVLLAVAVDGALGRWQSARVAGISAATERMVSESLDALPPEQRTDEARMEAVGRARTQLGSGELTPAQSQAVNLVTLLVAIGGVSWLTMARVIRGQVLSLKAQPFMEAARAIGVGVKRQFSRHLLPNLVGPIVVYATLMVPQAMLQESFLSFLGIGVKPPLPSWGNLAADALGELNTVRSHWWLLLFPCLLLGVTLLSLNFVGEAIREAVDPRLSTRRAGGGGGGK
ncbi:MAG: ABC transporter permease [Phycisphaerales bacterium]|nr:ABC transporter permease [Phycisphaerales bacterium]